MSRRAGVVAACLLLASACSGSSSDAAGPAPSTSTTTTAPPTVALPELADVMVVDGTATVELGEAAAGTWPEAITIGYGEAAGLLGTSPGGDGMTFGPDSCERAADGSWWIVDPAKYRFVRFAADGELLDEVVVGDDLLVNGNFQWQTITTLADGGAASVRFGMEGGTSVMIVSPDGALREFDIAAEAAVPRLEAGGLLYLTDLEGTVLEVDPAAGTAVEVPAFRTRSGARFALAIDADRITVSLPDADPAAEVVVHFVAPAAMSEREVRVTVAVDTTSAGDVVLFVRGFDPADGTTLGSAVARVAADGSTVGAVALPTPPPPVGGFEGGNLDLFSVDPAAGTPHLCAFGAEGVMLR